MRRYYWRKRGYKKRRKEKKLFKVFLGLSLILLFIFAGAGLLFFIKSKINFASFDLRFAKFPLSQILSTESQKKQPKLAFSFAILADSHEDENYMPKALGKIGEREASFLIHLGDLVNSGSLEKMEVAKKILDGSGLKYYPICGDHDHNFWPKYGTENYQKVFGDLYYSIDYLNAHLIFLYNSNEEEGINKDQMSWLEKDLERKKDVDLIFIFLHKTPSHPFFTKVMGEKNEKIRLQAMRLLDLAKGYKIKEIFAGDVHFYSRFSDTQTGVKVTTVGAIGSYQNLVPQYVFVKVFEDNTYKVEAVNL